MASIRSLSSLPLLAALAHALPQQQSEFPIDPATLHPPTSVPQVTISYAPSPVAPEAFTTSLTGIPTYNPSPVITQPAPEVTQLPKADAITLPACKKIQFNYPKGQGGDATKAKAVAAAFTYAWNGYKQYGFPKDELQPLTKSGIDDWYGWGVTVVEAFDTAIVMGLTDIVSEQLAFIETIDFSTTTLGPVEVFDTNIRYLGGLLSAYDMLKSGQFPNTYPKNQVNALLKQAVVLADKLSYVFDTPSGLPAANLDWVTNTPVEGTYTVQKTGVTYNSTNTASCGTWILEFARLSDLTGNATYRQITQRAESYIVNPQPKPVYPGLVGSNMDTTSGKFLSYDGGWHADVDSAMEYLIKTFQYKKTAITTQYKNFWLQAVQSTAEHLAISPQGFPNIKYISALGPNGSVTQVEDSFTCFAGGNFLLGGALLGREDLTQLGIDATDSCHWTYNHTLTGLGPTEWQWYNPSGKAFYNYDNNDSAERAVSKRQGFWITQGAEAWEFRPEHIESNFYAHRLTGDPRWAQYNWEIFQAMQATAKNDVAYASVYNVNMQNGGSMNNYMDSFLFAEVFKYLYLTFADPSVIDLSQWVFNTECHPFLAQCGIGAIDDYSNTAAGGYSSGKSTATAATSAKSKATLAATSTK